MPFRKRSSVNPDRTLLLRGRLLAGRATPDARRGPAGGHRGQRAQPSVEGRPRQLAGEPAAGRAGGTQGYQRYHLASAPRAKNPITQISANTTARMNSHLTTKPNPTSRDEQQKQDECKH